MRVYAIIGACFLAFFALFLIFGTAGLIPHITAAITTMVR